MTQNTKKQTNFLSKTDRIPFVVGIGFAVVMTVVGTIGAFVVVVVVMDLMVVVVVESIVERTVVSAA